MVDVSALPVTDVLGWKVNDEKTYALIGFKHPTGAEIALAIPPEVLDETIAEIAHSKSAFDLPRGMGTAPEFAMKADRADFGTTPSTNTIFLRLHLAGGGQLGFSIEPVLARRLAEGLLATLGSFIPLEPGPSRH